VFEHRKRARLVASKIGEELIEGCHRHGPSRWVSAGPMRVSAFLVPGSFGWDR
jgi:hypothetical protein